MALVFAVAISSSARAAFSYDPALQWHTLRSAHFNIHFHDGEESVAQEVAAAAERVHQRLQPFFEWTPAQPTNIVLSDRMDFSNGSATPAPDNRMLLLVSPPDEVNTLEDYSNWMELLIQHEYTHVLHIDKASGPPRNLRALFGRLFPWLFPNLLQPAWPIEGLATYLETDTNLGIGRGQSSAYQMLMRLEVANGVKPISQVNQPMVSWPAGGARYLYGAYFMQFIAEKYGVERLRRWIDAYGSNLLPFALNSTSEAVFGLDMTQLWHAYTQYLNTRFQPQLTRIAANGLREGEQLTHDGYYTNRPQVLPNGDVYYVRDDFLGHAQLMHRSPDASEARPVAKIRGNRFDVHPGAGILIAQLEVSRNTNVFSDLYRIDIKTHAMQRLTQGRRYRSATWHPDGKTIVAVHGAGGNSSLHLLSDTGQVLDTLWQGAQHEVIGEPRWSPDGTRLVAAVWRLGQWDLETFTLADRQWRKLTDNTEIESQPRFTADGTAVIFSADYEGVYNIRRLALANAQLTTLTNVRGGAFDPTLSADEKTLYYAGTTARGYDIFRLVLSEASPGQTLPAPQPSVAPAPATIDAALPAEHYAPGESLRPTWWFPYFLIADGRNEFGAYTGGSDVLDRHSYALFLAYDFSNAWWLGDASYIYDRWNPTLKVRTGRLALETRDSNDELQRMRFSDSITAEAVFPWISLDAQWGAHAAVIYDEEHDARVFNNAPDARAINDTLLGIGVTYHSAARHPISVSPNDGRRVQLTHEHSDVLASDYSGAVTTLDWREYLRVTQQHVLALRALLGSSTEHPRPYRLGGIAGEEAPHPLIQPTEQLFNRRQFALRGYPTGLPGLRGNQLTAYSAEWRFPLRLVETGAMVPPLGIHQIHGDVFYNAGEAWFDGQTRESLRTGAGVELHTEIVLGYWLLLDLRLGAAQGFDDGGERQLYLSVGASY